MPKNNNVKWPLNKEFAFTIIDDTDNSNLENVETIYEYLKSKNIKTTKTVWVYPSRNYLYRTDNSR